MLNTNDNAQTDTSEASDDLRLIRRIQSAASLDDGIRARATLLERHNDLISAVVCRAVPRHLWSHAEDARQEACCALLEAVETFDLNRGGSFRAFARIVMLRHIYAYLDTHRNLAEGEWFGRNLRRLRKCLAQDGRGPDEICDAEFAARTGMTVSAIRRLRPWLNSPVELNATTVNSDEEQEEGIEERIPCDELLPPETVVRVDAWRQVKSMVGDLSPADRYLLTRVFGLDGADPGTVAEAAAALGLKVPAAAMRLHRTVRRLRHSWRD